MLLLDEPTNHLDMTSKDVLKNALLRYDGTLIIVSHDRDFLQGLTDKVVEFRNMGIKVFLGDMEEYLARQKEDILTGITANNARGNAKGTENSGKNQWEEKKRQETMQRKMEKRVRMLEGEIEAKEQALDECIGKMNQPEQHAEEIASGALSREYQQLKDEIDMLLKQWEEASSELEQSTGN